MRGSLPAAGKFVAGLTLKMWMDVVMPAARDATRKAACLPVEPSQRLEKI